jgi:hypothetical protein
VIGKYQVAVLGHEGDRRVAQYAGRLNTALRGSLKELGVDPKKFLTLIGSGVSTATIDRRMPSVGVFFGLQPAPALSRPDGDLLANLLADGVLVVPVVADSARFGEFVPPEISHLNGVSVPDCGADFERLAARILEGFRLLREARHLFISYRRKETSNIAGQLYEALDEAGFDVFLDTHGALRPGDPFQELLWHRLADTDVAVLLDSPDFLASRWTEEELARANTSNIQMLQVLWPGQREIAAAAFSMFHPLTADDFEGPELVGVSARLRDGSINAIVDAVESVRARAIGARHAFLVREFVLEARKEGLDVRATLDRAIVVSRPGSPATLVQPAVGVPSAERYQSLEDVYVEESKNGGKYATPSVLLYDQTGIRAQWMKHLSWLNGNVGSVRSISLVDARDWLKSLK